MYTLIIQPGYPGIPAGQFTQANIVAKEFSGTAWIWLSTRQWNEPAYLPLGAADPPGAHARPAQHGKRGAVHAGQELLALHEAQHLGQAGAGADGAAAGTCRCTPRGRWWRSAWRGSR